MDLDNYYIDELIEMRKVSREQKDFNTSDKIRDYLDSKNVIVFDSKDGQIVYNTKNKTRAEVIDNINKDKRANAMFDSWLFSMNKSEYIKNN